MPTALRTPKPLSPSTSLEQRSADYERMQRSLDWLGRRWRERPSLEEAAAEAGLSPHHFQRIFTRWAGVSPKTFMAALTHAQARESLEAGASVLDAAFDAGLSGPSRLHDLFVVQEGVTPGQARRRGEGLEIAYGFAPSPFGRAVLALAPKGLCGLGFVDAEDDEAALADLRRRWPAATWAQDDARAGQVAGTVFDGHGGATSLVLMGAAVPGPGLEGAPAHRAGPNRQLWPGGRLGGQSNGLACDRGGDRRQSDQLSDPLPPRHRRGRPADRLSLGPSPQGGHARTRSGRRLRIGGVVTAPRRARGSSLRRRLASAPSDA